MFRSHHPAVSVHTVTVFESDASLTPRKQGGSLDLRHESVRAANLYDEFQRGVQKGGDAMTIMDHLMNIMYTDKGDGSRPEIERSI